MSDHQDLDGDVPGRTARPPYGVPVLETIAEHWGLVVGYGVASLVLGIILAVWPGQTLVVCAVLVAIQLLVTGIVRIVTSIAGRGLDGGLRALVGLSGALALVIGLLCLRHPVQTLLAVSILLGVWWVLAGIIDILGALLSPVPGRRAWDAITGLISIAAGAFLLIDPRLSVGVLVVVVCAWLIATGAVTILAGLRLRAHAAPRSGAAGPEPGLQPLG